MQEFILLADFISPPHLVFLVDNGVYPHLKTEDELSKTIQTGSVKNYSLLKSLTKLQLELHNESIMYRLVSLHIANMQGLKLVSVGDNSSVFKVTFENTLDNETLTQYLSHSEEMSPSSHHFNKSNAHKSPFVKVPKVPKIEGLK